MVLGLVLWFLEGEVVLDGTAGELGLLGLARADGRDDQPVAGQKGQGGEEGKENRGLEPTADLPGKPVRGQDQQAGEGEEGEAVATGAISGQWSVLDGGVLQKGGKR